MNLLGRAAEKGMMTPEAASDALQKAVDEASLPLQQVGDKYVRPAYTSHELAAIIGETLAEDALKAQGHVVFADWKKHVSGTGFDMASYSPAGQGELWIVDNKAQFRGIGDASALTGAAFDKYKAELRSFLEKTWPNKAEADLALKALDAGRIKLVVSNGFAFDTTRFTKGLFDKGLHAFDVRLAKLFSSHAEWEPAYKALTLKKGARITGQRGAASVGGMLFVLASAAGAAILLKAGGGFKTIVGEVAANVALDVALSLLPGGFFASYVIGMESDQYESPEQRATRKLNEQIDTLLSALPDVGSLSEEDLKTTRDNLKAIIQNPLVIKVSPEPQPPSGIRLPGFQWLPHPDWA